MDRKHAEDMLNQIRCIKGASVFCDVHVHPFEVIDGAASYELSPAGQGLYSSTSSGYVKPAITDFDTTPAEERLRDGCSPSVLDKMLTLSRRRIYAHSGPAVFSDHMSLSGIDKLILLPVLAKNDSGNKQLLSMYEMFGNDNRYILGYCLPNDIPDNEISENIGRIAEQFDVGVLKIHPALQGINTFTKRGKERIERILAAAGENALNVIIHGGLSPYCKDADAVAYGSLLNLQDIDWSVATTGVVIAHAGAYGYAPAEVARDVLPILDRLLNGHSKLVVDVSALEIPTLSLVFKNIDIDRICFGSDTLYEKQWEAMIKAWCALCQSVEDREQSLLKIASVNPLRLFPEENANA